MAKKKAATLTVKEIMDLDNSIAFLYNNAASLESGFGEDFKKINQLRTVIRTLVHLRMDLNDIEIKLKAL